MQNTLEFELGCFWKLLSAPHGVRACTRHATCTKPTLQWSELQHRWALPEEHHMFNSDLMGGGAAHSDTLLLPCGSWRAHSVTCLRHCVTMTIHWIIQNSLTIWPNASLVEWSRVGIIYSTLCVHTCVHVCSGEWRTRNSSGGESLNVPFFIRLSTQGKQYNQWIFKTL